MMGRQKKDGNNIPPNNKLVQEPKEMNKTDTQIQTPTKQRETMPKNPTKPTRTI
jgi:hypothetical protein